MEQLMVSLPKDLTPQIADKISQAVRENYYWEAANVISEAVKQRLEEIEFANEVADAVVTRIKLDKEDYIKLVAERVQKALLDTTGVLATTVLEKVSKRVQEFGFIKIGNIY